MKVAQILGALCFLAVVAWFAMQSERQDQNLLISEAVAVPFEDGDAAALLTIENRGAPDRVIDVASPIADAILHSPETPEGPPVPTGSSTFVPEGAHIRLSSAKEALTDGALIPLTLTFAEAGEVTAKLRLVAPKMQDGGMHGAHHFGMVHGYSVGEDEPAPTIGMSVEPEGDGWRVMVEASDFTFSEEQADGEHVPGIGHGHLYVGGMKIGRLYEPEGYIGALPKGQHEIHVTLNTNDHRVYMVDGQSVAASTTIVVD